jgi:hypothetical protein
MEMQRIELWSRMNRKLIFEFNEEAFHFSNQVIIFEIRNEIR